MQDAPIILPCSITPTRRQFSRTDAAPSLRTRRYSRALATISASVIKGYARASSMDELDVVGSVMTIGPCHHGPDVPLPATGHHRQFVLPRVHVIRHTHEWMVSLGTEESHTPGRFVCRAAPAEKSTARRYGFAMFSIGISLYFVPLSLGTGRALGSTAGVKQTWMNWSGWLDRMLVFLYILAS